MSKRRPIQEEEITSSWMDTYGDMVTLLLTFFVLLFSFSSIDAEKWRALVISFSGVPPADSMGALDPGASAGDPVDQSGNGADDSDLNSDGVLDGQKTTEQEFNDLYERIKKHIEEKGLASRLSVEKHDNEIILRLSDSILFDSGSAKLVASAGNLVQEISGLLMQSEGSIGMVRIEGHTDNRPISNSMYADNWELSAARAYTVLHFLEQRGMPKAKLSFQGFGEQQPIASNKTDAGKAKNRRVDFVIIRK